MIEGRLEKSVRNVKYSILRKVLLALLSFATRSVFIYVLGVEMLGISDVLASVLTILSLAELGIGEAVSYCLYKPLNEGDYQKVYSLMRFIKKCYYLIAAAIVVLGLCIVPTLPTLLGESINIENIYVYYALYVLQSASSYLMAYKRLLLVADQKNYKDARVQMIVSAVYNVLQISTLILFKNYVLYLSLILVNTLVENIIVSTVVNKEYKGIDDKNVAPLTKDETKSIFKNFFALAIQKLQAVIYLSIDRLVISVYIGTVAVGYLSNFTYLTNVVQGFLVVLYSAISGSIGSVIVSSSKEHTLEVFERTDFITFWMFAFCGICLFNLLNPFVSLVYGESFATSEVVIALVVLNFYVLGMRQSVVGFKNAYGLYWEDWFKPLINVALNVSLSIVLVKYTDLGVVGTLIATVACYLCVNSWIEPIVLFKYGIKASVGNYFKNYVLRMLLFVALNALFYFLFRTFAIPNGWLDLIVKALILLVGVNGILWLLFRKDENFIYYKTLVFSKLIKKKS